MRDRRALLLSLGVALLPVGARAHDMFEPHAPGSLVGVSVEVDGTSTPFYPAPDGSGRYYFEARERSRYAVRLDNRTGERVGVVLTVDGLNAISGQRDGTSPWTTPPGRMYVLDPWGSTTVRGWRTSLSEVRQFTFVDERTSYAARSGKANAKMGWIEIAAYREKHRWIRQPWQPREPWVRDRGRPDDDADAPRDQPAPPTASSAPEAEGRTEGQAAARGLSRAAPAGSYPGTGWGRAADDPAEVVSFDPEPQPADAVTLRYEYASALRALGILPAPYWGRDRLRERDRGVAGFAAPPAW
jgi:hypothetical protein